MQKEPIRNKRVIYLGNILLVYLVIQFVTRIILLIFSKDVISLNLFDLLKTFSLGVVFDAATGVQALLPLALLLVLLPVDWFKHKAVKGLLALATFGLFFLMLFISASEYFFWEEFQTTFNFIAVDYLIYTTEVLGNIQQSYNVGVIIPALMALAAILAYWHKRFSKLDFTPLKWTKKLSAAAIILFLPVLFFYTLDSAWRNYASENKYNVELAGNGPYEFVSAFRNNELDYWQFYLTKPDDMILQLIRGLLKTRDARFLDDNSAWRRITADRPLKTPHIVMIIVESLSTDYMERFGNKDNLTPRLDQLSRESLFFTRAYATGTRTVRGVEALALSVPPIPGQSIVRRPDNNDMFVLASALKPHGYVGSFLYGGYGYFDNMNAFFHANGHTVIDRTDIPKNAIIHENIWGVADEVIFTCALEEMDKKVAEGHRVLQFIVTTSNHRPFTYPENRIDIPAGTRLGAVKYTEWAIGDFIDRAKKKSWFDDTLFIIIADHQALSAGKTVLPVHRYHIPVMLYAPSFIQPEENDRLISQIDVPPTILGLLGHSYDSSFLGYDINRLETGRERAFISTYQLLGYMRDDKLVVLSPRKQSVIYRIDDFSQSLYTDIGNDETLLSEAIAWYQGTNYLYKNRLFKNRP